ncbi:MAG: NTP transferase domain-containing protein [Clostridium sp.]|uniref:NTP transferase domain-containing protein n=1 Tax=Clostridium sp. TaxID=1506 RepID=UPI0025C26656|nr:NTP transferase domain-containing protein [Clostridium sp.]MCF0147483.1 NTP transferase domain-containing protein [Clostridium sp.]
MRKDLNKITAGVIVASRKRGNGPLVKIGSISIIKRIVLTFQQVGISPIVVVTGYEAEDVEHDLADYGVIFLKNEKYEEAQMFDSAKLGLDFLKDKCHQVIFNPVNIPMFTPKTIEKMMDLDKKVVSPSYNGKSGHPLLISAELIPEILNYKGNMGLRGAIKSIGVERFLMSVDDEGIFSSTDDIERLDQLLEKHNQNIVHPFVRISIENETLFFNSRTKLLLLFIQETHSVRNACKHIALSYSKAWNMINKLEKELGYPVVKRQHGGKNGGKTSLTDEGIDFLRKYEKFEEDVRQYAKSEFNKWFKS